MGNSDVPAAEVTGVCAGCRERCETRCPACELPLCLICEIPHWRRCLGKTEEPKPE